MSSRRIALLASFCVLFPTCTVGWFGCADDLWSDALRSSRSRSAQAERFSIEVRERGSQRRSFVFSRGKEFAVQIVGDSFSWAEIHARSALFPYFVVGEFVRPPPKYFQLRNCSGRINASVVTLSGANVSRRHGAFFWRAPSSSRAGPLAFVARILTEDGTVLVQSPILTPLDAQFEHTSCGRDYGCATIGERAYVSVRWRCFREHVLVELASIDLDSATAFGMTTGQNTAALCTVKSSRPLRVSFREYKLTSSRHAFPSKSRNATFLRGRRDSGTATCRFEIPRPQGRLPAIVFGKVDKYGHPSALRKKRLRGGDFCDPSAFPMPHRHSHAKLSATASTEPYPWISMILLMSFVRMML
ncbi:hypothetical protein QR680_012822 [Steinernema hermaphroditum]|uniref:Reelin domain-containing protein n=1 Tax=Steinernema hermaphroditum TaxID=289476 RepID=A0AA39M183_9BILA|nr:hypothetical protein QR680_012822 [Steinernema hermaphroditum]